MITISIVLRINTLDTVSSWTIAFLLIKKEIHRSRLALKLNYYEIATYLYKSQNAKTIFGDLAVTTDTYVLLQVLLLTRVSVLLCMELHNSYCCYVCEAVLVFGSVPSKHEH